MVSESVEIRVGSQGRMVLPSQLRRELGAEEGAIYLAYVEDDGRLVLESRTALLRRMQQEFRGASADRSPVDELIEERRREAEAEDAS